MARPRVLVIDPRDLVAGAIVDYLQVHEEVPLTVERMPPGAAEPGWLPESDVIVADEAGARRLIGAVLDARVIALVDHRSVRTTTELVALGAAAVCVADEGLESVVAAVEAVATGGMWLPPDLVGPVLEALMHWRVREDEARRMLDQLTNREREVLALLAQGFDRAAIAQRLALSPHTVRTHVQHVLSKLSLHSQLAAAAVGRRLFEQAVTDPALIDLRDLRDLPDPAARLS